MKPFSLKRRSPNEIETSKTAEVTDKVLIKSFTSEVIDEVQGSSKDPKNEKHRPKLVIPCENSTQPTDFAAVSSLKAPEKPGLHILSDPMPIQQNQESLLKKISERKKQKLPNNSPPKSPDNDEDISADEFGWGMLRGMGFKD
jgi:G-patch domain